MTEQKKVEALEKAVKLLEDAFYPIEWDIPASISDKGTDFIEALQSLAEYRRDELTRGK